uniref:Uncharacterized protein n=1 Tax=Magallana gigas TaxID=29159 RepID=A0A8W8MDU3_MAGGI
MGVINIFSVVCMVYLQIYKAIDTQICDSINGTKICCSGYRLNNEQNQCIPCLKGYNGILCEEPCVFPYYGFDCQSQCNCTEVYCNYADGCNQFSEIENVEMKNNKDNPYCPSIHKNPPKEKTPLIVGITVLAAVAFIISLTILFTYQIEKRQGPRNCRERSV